MRVRISKNISYEELQRLINTISQEYDDVFVEVKPQANGSFYAYVVIRTPEIDVAKIF
jgi:phage terminase large subunit-like protein